MIIFPKETIKVGSCIAIYKKVYDGTGQGLKKAHTEYRASIPYKGRKWKSSRLSYHLNIKSLPKTPKTLKRGIVCHTCDNQWCINPKHLYLGTQHQNIKDIWKRNKDYPEKRRKAMIGNTNSKGKKKSKKTLRLLSIALMGNKNKLGKKESLETRRRKSESAKLRWKLIHRQNEKFIHSRKNK